MHMRGEFLTRTIWDGNFWVFLEVFGFAISRLMYLYFCILQNRLLAMNYINEGTDDKLYEAHRFYLLLSCGIYCIIYDAANATQAWEKKDN